MFEEEKEVVVFKVLVSDFAEGIKVIKNVRLNEVRMVFGVAKLFFFGKNVRKIRS